MLAFAAPYDEEKSDKEQLEKKYAKQKYALRLSVIGAARGGAYAIGSGGCWGGGSKDPKDPKDPTKVLVKIHEKTKSIDALRVTLIEVAKIDKKTYQLKSIRYLHFKIPCNQLPNRTKIQQRQLVCRFCLMKNFNKSTFPWLVS